MPEVTNERAQNPEARRGVPTPDHGITITEVHLPAGTPLQASCLCGWQSPIVPSRPQAGAHGEAHLTRIATEHARAVRESIERPRETDCAATITRHPLCTLAGGGFEYMTDDKQFEIRHHEGPVVFAPDEDDYMVVIGQREMRSVETGVTHFEPASAVVYTSDDRVYLPGKWAKTVAAAIVTAADKIDEAAASQERVAAKPLAVWQALPYPAWCDMTHPDNEHPDDRYHGGEIRYVGLRSYPAVRMGDNEYQLARWATYLKSPIAGGEPVVRMYTDEIKNGSVFEVEMHLDEAKRLVSVLLDTIAEAATS